ncbi:methyltransferase [Aureococcus anophagefferens]|nr:methyltransferase [Aureococcus anophagefferens]
MALPAALILLSLPCASFGPAAQRRRAVRRRASPVVAPEPSEAESRFGRQSYWDGVYADEAAFSWYCNWADVEPLWLELVPDRARVLVPAWATTTPRSRTVRRWGVVLSLSAPATEPIDRAFRECRSDGGGRCWKQLIDGDSFVTDDGFASINVDATILAWERL